MEERKLTILLAEYDHAREVAHHNDRVIYEAASIVWATNAVLLGFVFDAHPTLDTSLATTAVSVIGILLSVFVMVVFLLLKEPQRIAFETCRRIEDEVPLPHRLHQSIDRKYPRGAARVWFRTITLIFLSIWLSVLVRSVYFVWRGRFSF